MALGHSVEARIARLLDRLEDPDLSSEKETQIQEQVEALRAQQQT